MKPACVVHDQINLAVLPVLGALTVLGLMGYVSTTLVSAVFTAYVAIDFFWILFIPTAVPSLPSIILLHHAVTLILLGHPLAFPELGRYTCWDGMCELNTFFLIARRQWKSLRLPFSILYWATFFPLRIFLYPYMLVLFYRELQAPQYPWWTTVLCCGSQVVLIAFNMILLWLSVVNWRRPPRKYSEDGTEVVVQQEELSTTTADSSGPRAVGSASAAVRLRSSKKQ